MRLSMSVQDTVIFEFKDGAYEPLSENDIMRK